MALRETLLATWYAPRLRPLAAALLPLAWVYGAVAAARRALYRAGLLRSERLPVPVVVVGNVTLGGTGKTPLCIALAHALAGAGRHPGFVSRGYGAGKADARLVRADDDPAAVGDEPLLLAATGFPVAVGHARAAAARALLAAHPSCDVVIADDGLQHYALGRDVEIAVIDAARELGNRRLLPAGPLREPAARLDEVDAVVRLVEPHEHRAAGRGARETTMTQEVVGVRTLGAPGTPVDPAGWAGRAVHAVAGIGRPQRFFDTLSRLGIRAVPHAFPDHHPFSRADLDIPGAEVILMTAKDGVKCARFADARCHVLDIRAVPDPALVAFLLARLDGRQAAGDPRLPGDQGPARLRP